MKHHACKMICLLPEMMVMTMAMFTMQRLNQHFCTGSGLEPGGHYVHEGTTLLSHQQLRGRLAGEVRIMAMLIMGLEMMRRLLKIMTVTSGQANAHIWGKSGL